MCYYILRISQVCWIIWSVPSPDVLASQPAGLSAGSAITWVRIEFYAWFGILISNAMFLFLRLIKKNALDPTVFINDNKKMAEIDTIIAMNDVIRMFCNETVPLFIIILLINIPGGH